MVLIAEPFSLEQFENHLAAYLKAFDFIQVAWLGGSAATKSRDRFSDTDLMIKVEKKSDVLRVFEAIEKLFAHQITHRWQLDFNTMLKFDQRFYVLNTGHPYYYLDVVLFSESNIDFYDEYLNFLRHGRPVVLFDKIGLFSNEQNYLRDIQLDMKNFSAQIEIFYRTTLKEIERNRFVDAFNFYIKFINWYVMFVRYQKSRQRFDFGLRYLSLDISKQFNLEIESLIKIKDLDQMRFNLNTLNNTLKHLIGQTQN